MRRRASPSPLALAVLAVAFLLRVYQLGAQSLWYDEAFSVAYAASPVGRLLSLVSQDNHPPLHFVLLHLWIRLAGCSEFAARFPSVIAGVIVVALALVLARLAWGERAGLAAAVLVGLSPLEVWYSQEARMYEMGSALSLVSLYVFWRYLASSRWIEGAPRGRSGRAAILAAAVGAAALYTHYYTGFVLLAENLLVGGLLLWRWARARKLKLAGSFLWAASQLGIMVLFAPWAPFLAERYATDATYWPGTLPPAKALGWVVAAFSGSDFLDRPWQPIAAGLLVSLSLLGIAGLARRRTVPGGNGTGRAIAGAILLVSVLVVVGAVVAISVDRPKFAPRYVLFVHPLLLAVVAGALGWVRRSGQAVVHVSGSGAASALARRAAGASRRAAALGGMAGAAGLAALFGLGLAGYYWHGVQARDNWRAVADFVMARSEPDDALVLVGGHAEPARRYYAGNKLDVFPMPGGWMPRAGTVLGPPEVAVALNQIAVVHRRVWLVLWQPDLADPTGIVLDQLRTFAREVRLDRDFGDIGLHLFDLRPRPLFYSQPPVPHPLRVVFGGKVELVGYDIEYTELVPGLYVHLALYWKLLEPVAVDYTAFTHVIDAQGRGVGQHDKRPLNYLYTMTRWPAGQIFKDQYRPQVRPGTPPGQYQIEVGLYDSATMQRLPARAPDGTVSDRVVLPTTLTVKPSPR